MTSILSDIRQTMLRIEGDIAHVIELRKQHLETDAGHALAEIDTKISGLKGWLEAVKQSALASWKKADQVAKAIKTDTEL